MPRGIEKEPVKMIYPVIFLREDGSELGSSNFHSVQERAAAIRGKVPEWDYVMLRAKRVNQPITPTGRQMLLDGLGIPASAPIRKNS